MGNLSNLFISTSYQSLIHLGSDNTASSTLVGLQDGLGNPIGIAVNTSGELSISGSFTSSLQQGFVLVGNALGKTIAVATSSLASTTDLTSLNAFSASQITKDSTLASYTGSNDTKWSNLGSQSGSFVTESETGSFARTNVSNTFVGNQTITGSLFVSGNINMVNGADIVTHHVRAEGSNGLELQTSNGTIIVAMGGGGGTQAGFVGAVTANSVSASSFTGLGNLTTYSSSVDSRIFSNL